MAKAAKLLIDENVHAGLAAILRQQGYDAVSVKEIGLRQTLDADLFAYAIREKRAIVTFNLVDFKLLAENALQHGHKFFGVVLGTRDKGLKNTLNEISKILREYSQDDLENNLLYFT